MDREPSSSRPPRAFSGPPAVRTGPLHTLEMAFVYALSGVWRLTEWAILLLAPRLLVANLRIFAASLRDSPYRQRSFRRAFGARRVRQSQGELIYGETPIATVLGALGDVDVGPGTRFVDLGCGRGRVLLAARFLGAEAHGVELLEEHVDAIREPLENTGITLEVGDAADARLDDVDVAFVTWTCMSERSRARLTENLRNLPRGARVLSVTWPIDDDGFETLWMRSIGFTWGRAELYASIRRAPTDEAER